MIEVYRVFSKGEGDSSFGYLYFFKVLRIQLLHVTFYLIGTWLFGLRKEIREYEKSKKNSNE